MSPSPLLGRTGRSRRGPAFLGLLLIATLAAGAKGTSPSLGPPLAPGLTLERELKGGVAHVYPVDLQAGQFLRVTVQEEGVDVGVELLDPDGKRVTGADSIDLRPPNALEDLACIVGHPGVYQLKISSSASGRYRMTVQALRGVEGEDDRLRDETVRAHWLALTSTQAADLERASGLWERLGELHKSAQLLYVLGEEDQKTGNIERALAAFDRSISRWSAIPDLKAQRWRSRALNWTGRLLKRLGRWEEAEPRFREAFAVAREAGDASLQAGALSNLGLLQTERGDLRDGIASQTEALGWARKAGDREIEGAALNNLAYAYEGLGEKQKALGYYQDTVKLARAIGDEEREATASNNLGDTYGSLGEWEQALSHYSTALALNRASKDRSNEAKTLIGQGAAYQRLGQYEKARRSYQQAFAIGDQEAQAAALTNEAFLSLKMGQAGAALEPARKALELSKSYPERELNARYALGTALRETGDLTASQEHLERALATATKSGNRSVQAEAGLALARTELLLGNRTTALQRLDRAIEIIESLRSQVFDPGLRASFLATKQDFYQVYIDALMSVPGEEAKAFEVAERARARSLLDILNEADADLVQGLDPALMQRERRLREELNARDTSVFRLRSERSDGRRIDAAERRRDEALDAYRSFQAELRAVSPAYAALTQPQPASVADIQKQVLDGRAILLEYSLGPKRSFLWAITPGGIQSFELPARDTIEATARRYYELLTARNVVIQGEGIARAARIERADAEAERAGRQLARMILAPAERLLQGRSVLVVADGALQYIPFAALPLANGASLVSGHEVVSLPSASVLVVLRRELQGRKLAPKTLAVFADPVFQKTDERVLGSRVERPRLALAPIRGGEGERTSFQRLPSSLKEAETIARLVPLDQRFLATGFAATREAVMSPEIGRYRNVHFATHGVLDSRRPDLSKLVLSLVDEKGKSQNGFLSLNDVYTLRLDADLVVLSACRTALGKEIKGEGLVGLTRGFMYAGSARVLASLWSVEDRPTAELMEGFYRRMLREKLSPAEALRKAQLEMAKKPNRKSPYYWAGFSLQGEWN